MEVQANQAFFTILLIRNVLRIIIIIFFKHFNLAKKNMTQTVGVEFASKLINMEEKNIKL